MSDVAAPSARSRLIALICGWLAAVPLTALIVWWIVLLLATRGGDRIILITPFAAFLYGAIVWFVLGLFALLLGRRADRPRLPVTLGWIVLGELALGIVLLLLSNLNVGA